jgi:hypothetical protein
MGNSEIFYSLAASQKLPINTTEAQLEMLMHR